MNNPHGGSQQGGYDVTPDMEVDVISYKEGLYLATLGSAKALGIDVSRTQLRCLGYW
jgi:hypothetical protein